jgi:hypothetical protein
LLGSLAEEEKSMTDTGSIWKSKLSRLQDPNLEKMKPLVELMRELREKRQEGGSHAPLLQALRMAHRGLDGEGSSGEEMLSI